MSKYQINSSEWKCKEQREINESSYPQLAIDELRKLVKSDTLLKSRMDDTFMLKFLRARKYHVENAFKLIQNYYKIMEKRPDLFNLTELSKSKVFWESGTIFMLPNRDQHGREIYVFRMKNILPGITIEDVFKMNLMILEIVSENLETQLAGIVAIADFTGFEWLKHYQFLSLYYAKKSAEVIQDSFPLKFRGFHFINEPLHIYTIYSIIKPFLKEKIRSRVHFHGNNFESLHEHLSPNILPTYFKGTLEFDPSSWVETFLSKDQYFKEMKQYGYNQ